MGDSSKWIVDVGEAPPANTMVAEKTGGYYPFFWRVCH
jgi:hypothetical protein